MPSSFVLAPGVVLPWGYRLLQPQRQCAHQHFNYVGRPAGRLINSVQATTRDASNRAKLASNVATEVSQMVPPPTQTAKSTLPARTPTEYLTQVKIEQLSQLSIFLLAREGFALKDVQAMLSISELYSSSRVIGRIVGKPIRTSQRQGDDSKTARLNVQQSAVAFQYAKVLEHATTVFGALRLAEEWLDRPCKHLAGSVPLDLIDNSLGFQAVEDYLERVELGVYQ